MSEVVKNISIIFELETSIKYLKRGLKELSQITPENDFYHPVFIFLSGGLERLLKVVVTLNFYEVHGRYPSFVELMPKNQNGHDLEYLLKQFRPLFFKGVNDEFFDDYNLIYNDHLTSLIVKPLSEFGKYGRYYNFDSVLGKTGHFDPKRNWESMETRFFKEKYGEKFFLELMQKKEGVSQFYQMATPALIEKLNSIIRAICRQFMHGTFSSKSKQFVFQIEDFL